MFLAVTELEVDKHLKRYAIYDSSSRGINGIAFDTVLGFPEYAINPLIPSVLRLFVDGKTNRVHAERFIYFCAALSSKMNADSKKRC